ncbi:MAG: hypothetical protein EOP06_11185 [Proteobacteria bacterium]|nr:MAG: hypothetical protein EOP06_11185 [Pseudomonadota bacterium]
MELERMNVGNRNPGSEAAELNAEPCAEAQGDQLSVPASFLDKIAERFSFYLENQQSLYRPVIWLSVILNMISFVSMIRVFLVIDILSPTFFHFDILYPLVTLPLAVLVALAARRELNLGKEQGITLFAVLLVLELMNFRIFVVFAGLFAVLNSAFRNHWKMNSPKWYVNIVKRL